MPANGIAYLLKDRAQPLANYPHMRKAGGQLYVSGLSSRRPDNSIAGATENGNGGWSLDIEAQTEAVIENLRTVLQQAGADLGNLVDITVFLVDMQDYQGFNQVYNRYFDAEKGPTRTTVAVRQLPHPQLLIEIKATALAPPQ